jgi:hypothetical protein
MKREMFKFARNPLTRWEEPIHHMKVNLRLFELATLLAVITCGAGCASMVDGGPTVVHINSEPTGGQSERV